MVGTIRVLVALSVIAQVVGVAAIRNADQVYRASRYHDLRHAGLLVLAALAALALVGLTVVIVAAIHLWEVGGGWRWGFLAGSLLCLVAQLFALHSERTVVYLVLVGVYVVVGLALSASLGQWRVVVRSR
jgi:4-amino-4-deoxy-L-arabinose transferase-like glycosyltransferase